LIVALHFDLERTASAGELMQYIDMRGMLRVLVFDEVVELDHAARAARLASTLQIPAFADTIGAASLHSTGTATLTDACSKLGVAPSGVIVVSDDPQTIGVARRSGLGVQTCYFRKNIPGVAQKIPSDFTAVSMLEVRHAIEAVNGVTYRDANTAIRTSFGVYSSA